MNEEAQMVEHPSALESFLGANKTARWILVAVFLVLALVSAIPAGNHFSSPEAYQGTIASLDEKRDVVTGLMALSAASSAAVSALPGDAGTPIADRLIGLSEDFLIVLTAIYLEKFLLTTFGFAAFRILIPAGLLFAIAAVLLAGRSSSQGRAGRIAAKLCLFGVMLAIVVPASVFIADKMEETHNASLATTLESIESEVSATEEAAQGATANSQEAAQGTAQDDQEAAQGTTQNDQETEETSKSGNFIQQLFSGASEAVSGAVDSVASSLSDTKEKALNLLSTLTDSLALLIVTSCIIPILVLVLFLWLMKIILGIDTNRAFGFLKPRAIGRATKFKG